jgi:hypothetical protein
VYTFPLLPQQTLSDLAPATYMHTIQHSAPSVELPRVILKPSKPSPVLPALIRAAHRYRTRRLYGPVCTGAVTVPSVAKHEFQPAGQSTGRCRTRVCHYGWKRPSTVSTAHVSNLTCCLSILTWIWLPHHTRSVAPTPGLHMLALCCPSSTV